MGNDSKRIYTIRLIGQPYDADPNSEFICDGYAVRFYTGAIQFFYFDECGGRREAYKKASRWARDYDRMITPKAAL